MAAPQISARAVSTNTPSTAGQPSISSPATTFYGFLLLPKELQLLIWDVLYVLEPRTVRVTLTRRKKERVICFTRPQFKLLTPNPVILHVCRDSREVSLKTYHTITFHTEDEDGVVRGKIYVNPMIDTILFEMPSWAKFCRCLDTTLKVPNQARHIGSSPITGRTHVIVKTERYCVKRGGLVDEPIFVIQAKRETGAAYKVDDAYA